MGPPQPQQGLLCSGTAAPCWPWWIGRELGMPGLIGTWRLDRMEGGGGGLRFLLHFDPGKVDRTALLGVSLSALVGRFLGWTKVSGASSVAGAEDAAAVTAAALAAAVSLCLAAMHASAHRHRRRRPPRLSAAALAGTSSAARPRALPAPSDGLRILSSEDASFENVIHGASIGAGDDEPVIVARVETATTPAGANADADGGEAERGRREEERGKQESDRLRELWLSLVEREQRLELRLQELQGLREQEAAVRELEHRVSAAATEARLLELRVASLQEENGRLRAQLEELGDARAELARAKEKLRSIKARVQAEQEEARREVAALRARVEEMERGGEERAEALAAEAAALREANAALEEENMELALRLQDAEQAASSVHLAQEEDMVEEATQLREANERLTRQVEELRNDQYAHVEELVYLKWVNACLRHELSDHGLHPPYATHQDHDADDGSAVVSGGMSAMDLSKSMSFRSSERAKQLMLRYGHPGLDPALLSPLHEMMVGDERTPARSPAGGNTPVATASTAAAPGRKSGQRKLKFLGNIKKLLPGGKRSSHSSHGPGGDREGRHRQAPEPNDEYLEKAMRWLSTHDVLDFDHSYESTPLSSCDRTPPSSVTTATTRGAAVTQEEEAAAELKRSKSDAGASYGRETPSRFHSLRPDHPADETGVTSEKKRGQRRRSEELMSRRSPGVARA